MSPRPSFTVDGQQPDSDLVADSNGDLFGTTLSGGTGAGTVFEIAKTPTGYASAATTLFNFSSDISTVTGTGPKGGLIMDASGDLFGTTLGGGPLEDDGGIVYEIAKTGTGYASTPTVVAAFPNGLGSSASVIADAHGDLFGTTLIGGSTTSSTVFEILKTTDGYDSTPKTLVSFDGADGDELPAGLIIDADGDLFGTTRAGGADGVGTVFEIAKTPSGYASMPTTVLSFNEADGGIPLASLVADASGDLFGTTYAGGSAEDAVGTVFEITGGGFVPTGASVTPPAVSNSLLFQNSDGQAAIWNLVESDLIGGGTVSPNPGTSWRAVGTGDFNDDDNLDILWQNASGQASIWEMNGNTLTGGGAVTPNPGPSWKAIGTGDFTGDGFSDDILWQNTTTGQASIWEMSGNTLIGGGAVTPNPGPAWKAIGTGDFNNDGHSDILWQNTSTGQVSIWEMNGNTLVGGGPVSINPGKSWQAIGTGDFNNDGHSDILFQNSISGQIAIWEMDGTSLIGGGKVSADPGPTWRAVGAGGEGTFSDILFQNASGQTAIWDMNGTTVFGGGTLSANPGPSWHAVELT
jgi:uncharacterized repeat protein (TIGR03803 family)